MEKFYAVTKSGTEYRSDGMLIRITSKGYTYSIRPLRMVAVDTEELAGLKSMDEVHYQLSTMQNTDVPVAGLSLYVLGRDDWRFSTPIETVEVYE